MLQEIYFCPAALFNRSKFVKKNDTVKLKASSYL